MASNMFIQFDGIKGEADDDAHKEWIEILSWSHGFSQPASPVRDSSGSTVERANHSDLSITKYLDAASNSLIKACWNGKQIETAKIECMRADGENAPLVYLKIDMDDVIISNVSLSGGGGDIPIENISLSYSKITYTYNQKKKEDATAAGADPISHDLKTNKVE